MIVKLLTEHHLEFLSLKGGCRGSSESTLVKMSLLEISCHGSIKGQFSYFSTCRMCKVNLKTCMHSYRVGLEVYIEV